MEGLFSPTGLLFIIAVAIILFFSVCLPKAADAGDKINAMVNAAKYEHDHSDGGER